MKVNLNTATAAELRAVGFGAAAAESVISRREWKPYTSVEELQKTRHVGGVTYHRVKDSVCVEEAETEPELLTVIAGLECCVDKDSICRMCPYRGDRRKCIDRLMADALAILKEVEVWGMI